MSSFTVTQPAELTVEFRSTIRGSRQESGDLQRFTLGIVLEDEQAWIDLLSCVTTKYNVHSPLGATVIIDVVRGSGVGTLVVDGLGETDAILTSLERSTYAPYDITVGTGVFLVTGLPL